MKESLYKSECTIFHLYEVLGTVTINGELIKTVFSYGIGGLEFTEKGHQVHFWGVVG